MELSRREVLGTAMAAFGAAVASSTAGQAQGQKPAGARTRPANEPFGYCLNTSTIRGNKLDIVGVVTAASKAGFHAIEPWITELDTYTASGGSLKDLGKRIADAGLTVEGAIAFNSFLEDEDARRAAALEKLKVDMDKVAQIGGKRIAAPPGSPKMTVSLDNAAKYLPRSARNGREGRSAAVARAVGHTPSARAALTRHLRDGCGRTARRQPAARRVPPLQERDGVHRAEADQRRVAAPDAPERLPAGGRSLPRSTTASRIYPGDGVAPLGQILRDLRDNGFRGYLSLELFNREYLGAECRRQPKNGDGENPRHGRRRDGVAATFRLKPEATPGSVLAHLLSRLM